MVLACGFFSLALANFEESWREAMSLYRRKVDGKRPGASRVIDKKEVLNFLFFSYLLEILGILSLDSLDLSLIISTSLLITILYTPFFKPATWLKNISVAFVVASTPFVGALSYHSRTLEYLYINLNL